MLARCVNTFKQLPTYQKMILAVSGISGSLIARVAYWKLVRYLYNYPPGPIGLPMFGHLLTLHVSNSAAWIKSMARYGSGGGVVMFYLGMTPFVLITDLKVFQDIFSENVHREAKGSMIDFPNPIPQIDDDKLWMHRRRLIHQSFTTLIQSSYIDRIMRKLMDEFMFPALDRKSMTGSPCSLRNDIKWLGFAFLFGVIYGVDAKVPPQNSEEFRRLIYHNDQLFASVVNEILIGGFLGARVGKRLNRLVHHNEMAHMHAKWKREFVTDGLDDSTYFGRMTKNIAEGEITVCQNIVLSTFKSYDSYYDTVYPRRLAFPC